MVQFLIDKGQITKAEELCEGAEMKSCFGSSCHKVWSRAIALQCPEKFEADFYNGGVGIDNPKWNVFVDSLYS